MASPPPVSLTVIQQAASRLKDVLLKTELIPSPAFSKLSKCKVWLKPENLQVTGSYKIRGAFNKVALLSPEQRKRGLIAASAGNHAQGVAFAASKAGAHATIVMPNTTPLIKINATKDYGVEVILEGNYYDEAYARAKELEAANNYTFIHPFDDWDIIAGQGTIGLEILAELPDADMIVVPIGGGGLISGVALAAKAINPDVKVVGVEPEGADAMYRSLLNKRLVTLERVHTIADSVAVARPGEKTFQVVSEWVDRVVRVPDSDIMEAFLILMEKHKMVAEPAGAVALAALLNGKLNAKGKVVAVLSGGNIDVVTMSALIERGLVRMGRVFEFSVDLPDRPGQLLAVARILAEQHANVIQIEHNQFENLERFTHVRLTITVETSGHEHIGQITQALKREHYDIVE